MEALPLANLRSSSSTVVVVVGIVIAVVVATLLFIIGFIAYFRKRTISNRQGNLCANI